MIESMDDARAAPAPHPSLTTALIAAALAVAALSGAAFAGLRALVAG